MVHRETAQIAVRYRVDHPETARLIGTNAPTRRNQLDRFGDTDQPRQTLRAASGGNDAKVTFRQADDGILGLPRVATQSDFITAAERHGREIAATTGLDNSPARR